MSADDDRARDGLAVLFEAQLAVAGAEQQVAGEQLVDAVADILGRLGDYLAVYEAGRPLLPDGQVADAADALRLAVTAIWQAVE